MAEEAKNTESSEQVIKGRSVFLVETTPAGIAVQTALLTEDGKLLNAPAIFPDVEYAFTQVDELKRLISTHFSQAARLGAQVAAQQAQANGATTETETENRPQETVAPPAVQANEKVFNSDTAQSISSKALENVKRLVDSGLKQVSRITRHLNSAMHRPENSTHTETTPDVSTNSGHRKMRSNGKKAKSHNGTSAY
ncbi:hypothetical protein [Limnohabitans sp. Rim47]|jgi:hypothetical protein|uniref:hypothetical protein n=1 Tax=Limnohabitans sp. Rim47 TaxID=1100721 RepID=UPI000360980E|nr:hypothetical protein [Limnohabitans sp. Rim47]